jgi:hypothetical protein
MLAAARQPAARRVLVYTARNLTGEVAEWLKALAC